MTGKVGRCPLSGFTGTGFAFLVAAAGCSGEPAPSRAFGSQTSSGGNAASGGASVGHSGGSGSGGRQANAGGTGQVNMPAVGGTSSGGATSGGSPGSGGAPNVGGATSSSGGAPPSGPVLSCSGLANTCGAMGNEDCCASPLIPGGTFKRGGDSEAGATLSSFRLDRFEVSVGRFRKFVGAYDAWRAAGHPANEEGANPKLAGSGWDASWNTGLTARAASAATLQTALKCGTRAGWTWTEAPGANETHPINCVNWYEAVAFCTWDGGRLPSEAEFNYAQAGGSEQRFYPWSMPPENEALSPQHPSSSCVGSMPLNDCLAKVGSKPAGDGKFGQTDLGASLWEWNLDWEVGYPDSCNDCASLVKADAAGRIVRGADFEAGDSGMSSNYRGSIPPDGYADGTGFRCARNP